MEVEFDQSSHGSHHDQNLIEEKLGHIGKIQEIIEVDFSSFQVVIFRWKWWDTFNQNSVKEGHDSGMICINFRKMLVETKDIYVIQKHYNQVFLYPNVLS